MRKPWLVTVVAAVLAFAVVVLDLSPTDDVDDADLRTAVEGTWTITLTDQVERKVVLRQGATVDRPRSGWVKTASACGTRTLVRSAHACISETMMPIEVTDVATGDLVGWGRFFVDGVGFEEGELEIKLDAIGDRRATGFRATISRDGRALDATSYGHPVQLRRLR